MGSTSGISGIQKGKKKFQHQQSCPASVASPRPYIHEDVMGDLCLGRFAWRRDEQTQAHVLRLAPT